MPGQRGQAGCPCQSYGRELGRCQAKIVRVESSVMDNTKRIQEVEKKLEGQEAAKEADNSNLRKE